MTLSSYKLWYKYLKLRRKQVKQKCVTDPAYEEVNNAFERALVFMHKVTMREEDPLRIRNTLTMRERKTLGKCPLFKGVPYNIPQ